MTRWLLRLISLLVPFSARPRWREEWYAEMNHARSRGRSLRDRLGMAAGSVPDAVMTRRIAMDARRTVGRRAGVGVVHGLDQDLRYALRRLARSPGFTFGAIASLSIGVAATAGAFTLLNAFVFSASPEVTDQDRLVRIAVVRPDRTIASTFDKYETLKRGLTAVSGIAAHHDTAFAIGRVAVPVDVPGAIVSGNYFAVLGVRPTAGRFFAPEEDGAPWAAPAAVISSRLWKRVVGASDAAPFASSALRRRSSAASAAGTSRRMSGFHLRFRILSPLREPPASCSRSWHSRASSLRAARRGSIQ